MSVIYVNRPSVGQSIVNGLLSGYAQKLQQDRENKKNADMWGMVGDYQNNLNDLPLGGQTTTVDMASPSNPQSNYTGKNVDQRAIQGLQQQGFLPNPDFLNNQPTADNIGKGLLGGLQQAQQQAQYFNMPQYTTGSTDGMVSPGNIDIANRPQVKNPDGSVSTVRSIGANVDGKEMLLPTIGPNGENWTNDQAVDNYRNTGQNLGTFATPAASDQYAQQLHDQQANMYQGYSNNPMNKYSKENNPVQQTTTPAMTLAQAKATVMGTIPKAAQDLARKGYDPRTFMPLLQQAAQSRLGEYTDQYNQTQISTLTQQFNASQNPYQRAMIAAQMKQYGLDLDPRMIAQLSPDYQFHAINQGDKQQIVLMDPKSGQMVDGGVYTISVSPDASASLFERRYEHDNQSADNAATNATHLQVASMQKETGGRRGGQSPQPNPEKASQYQKLLDEAKTNGRLNDPVVQKELGVLAYQSGGIITPDDHLRYTTGAAAGTQISNDGMRRVRNLAGNEVAGWNALRGQ